MANRVKKPTRVRTTAKPTLGHIKDLTPDPANARKHGPRNVGTIVSALQEVGAARSIVIDEAGVILAGNATVEAAAEAGITKLKIVETDGETIVAVRRMGLTAAQKARLALFDNRAGELAEGWETGVLKELQAQGISLEGLWSEDELAALLAAPVEPSSGLTDPDDVPDQRPTDIKPGDLFKLGRHRIQCGDSTNAEQIATLLNGVAPRMTLTDPPYSVNYQLSFSKREGGKNAGRQTEYSESNDASALLIGFLSIEPSGFLVMTYPVDRHLFDLSAALTAAKFESVRELVWAKDAPTFHPGSKYQQQHEPILICRRKGVGYRTETPKTAKTILTADRPKAHGDHPTEKPQSLWQELMVWHTSAGDVVFEPFSGSGTTLMAGEVTGRVVVANELKPEFVQVSIDRWEAFTGQKAQKVGDAVSV